MRLSSILSRKYGLLISEFVKKLQTPTSLLTSVGCAIGEQDQVFALCNGLDGSYESVVANVQEGYILI